MFSKKRSLTDIRLENIMSEYYRLAGCDANKLRSLIPGKEMWRFFVEERLYTGHLQKLISRSNQSVLRYAEQQEGIKICVSDDWINSKTGKKLAEWGRLSFLDASGFTVNDLYKIDKGWIPFELREPGYLKAMVKTFQYVFDNQQQLNVDFIKLLHASTCKDVGNTNYDKYAHLGELPGKFKQYCTRYGLTHINSTPEGILNVLNKNNYFLSFAVMIDNTSAAVTGIQYDQQTFEKWHLIIDYFSKKKNYQNVRNHVLTRTLTIFEIMQLEHHFQASPLWFDLVQRIFGGPVRSKEQFATLLGCFIRDTNNSNFSLSLCQDVIKSPAEHLEKLIKLYNNSIQQASTPWDKLTAIVSLITDLEQAHLFVDANGRTFCMVLLNFLLLRNGFPLCILSEPNHFDGYSEKELLFDILTGMENTLSLVKEGKLFNLETDDVLQVLKGDQRFMKFAQYFSEAIDIEEHARQPRMHIRP